MRYEELWKFSSSYATATLSSLGEGRYQLSLDGQRVAKGFAAGSPARVLINAYDSLVEYGIVSRLESREDFVLRIISLLPAEHVCAESSRRALSPRRGTTPAL